MKKLLPLLFILIIAFNSSAQNKKPKAYMMSWDITIFQDNTDGFMNFKDFWKTPEIDYYSKDYKKRITPLLEAAFKAEDDIDFKLAPLKTYTPEEMQMLLKLKEFVRVEYFNTYIPSGKYRNKKFNKTANSEYIETLNYFADKMNSDILTFIYLDGFVKEKPNKKGKYDENAKGYINYAGVIINANNGKVIEDFYETYPKSTAGSVIGDAIPRSVLTDSEIERISRKFIKKLGRDYEKAVSKIEK